jgi:hypothetical protein
MKKLLLAIASLAVITGYYPALAADLPAKALPQTAPVAAYNPFYIGIQAGMGFTPDQNVIATPGLAVGTPKVYPTSPSFGVVLGYLNNTNALAYGAELYADYNLSQGGISCDAALAALTTTGCLARSRNTFGGGADFLFGFTAGQVIGAVPANAQPQNWRLPITVPTSVMNNLQLLGSVGAYGRQAGLCVADLGTGQDLCGSEWMGGLSVGGQLRFMAAKDWDVAVRYHHDFIRHTFTPTQSIPLFTNSVAAKDQDRFTVGMNFHLSPL